MKKTYINPQVQIVHVEVHGSLMQNISVSEAEISSTNAGLTKDEGDWDDDLWDE